MAHVSGHWLRFARRCLLPGALLGVAGLLILVQPPARGQDDVPPELLVEQPGNAPAPAEVLTANINDFIGKPARANEATADHTQFAILQQEFKSGPEVTAACLSCHTEAAEQVMGTSHWTWICPRAREELAAKRQAQGEPVQVGKAGQVLNNFCIALPSNEPRCTSCHAGYGWTDKSFDFNDQSRVDCLVCHDTTRTYRKFPVDAGHPNYVPKEWPKGSGKVWQPPDLAHVAQHVGKPDRHNCGACHFFGGGGQGVKHGDMDQTLDFPDRSLDVHMQHDGLNFSCTECHTTEQHKVAGRCFTIPAVEERVFVMRGINTNLLACESCHDADPHVDAKLNQHTDRVACQACHIPTMARQRPTKMWWDWSEAGRKSPEGRPQIATTDIKGDKVQTYNTKKGSFIWAKDEAPEYVWFNGEVSHTFIGDKIDDVTPGRDLPGVTRGRFDRLDLSKPVVQINRLHGDADDPQARIYPVKVHRGIQPYDPQTKLLAVPHLFGNDATAYWKNYDWDAAVRAGMNYVELPYSGEYGWIQSEMSWPLAHMVAPKEHALRCVDCHTAAPVGRMAGIQGVYIPGRDAHAVLDRLGWILISLVALSALAHAGLRLHAWRRNRG